MYFNMSISCVIQSIQNLPKYVLGFTSLSIATKSGLQLNPCSILPIVGINDPPACEKHTLKLGNFSNVPLNIKEHAARDVSAGIPTSHGSQYFSISSKPIIFHG